MKLRKLLEKFEVKKTPSVECVFTNKRPLFKGATSPGFCYFRSVLCYNRYLGPSHIRKMLLENEEEDIKLSLSGIANCSHVSGIFSIKTWKKKLAQFSHVSIHFHPASVAADGRKQFHKTVFNNKTTPLFLELNWCQVTFKPFTRYLAIVT